MIRFLFLILLISFYLNANEQNTNIQVIDDFKSIPLEEQKEIKLFFRKLFFDNVFAYSLFGDKPMSFSRETLNEYSSDELVNLLTIDGYCQGILEFYCDPSNHLEKQWKIWQKYKHFFIIKNYSLIKKFSGGQIRIFFINKKYLIKTVLDNIKLFEKIIGSDLSIETLIRNIESSDVDIFDTLHNNEALLGILLGFGKYNSMLFQKREELLSSLGKNLKNPELIQEKIKMLDEKLQPLHEYDRYIITTIHRIGFVADPNHSDTVRLRKKYDELEKIINEIYSKDDWFEKTLLQLTSNEIHLLKTPK